MNIFLGGSIEGADFEGADLCATLVHILRGNNVIPVQKNRFCNTRGAEAIEILQHYAEIEKGKLIQYPPSLTGNTEP